MEYFGMATFSTFPHLNSLLLPESTLPGYPRLLLEPPAVPCPRPASAKAFVDAFSPRWWDMLALADGLFKGGEEIGISPNKSGLFFVGQTLLVTSVVYFSWRVSKGWNSELRVEHSNQDITKKNKEYINEPDNCVSTRDRAELEVDVFPLCTESIPVHSEEPVLITNDAANTSLAGTAPTEPKPKSGVTTNTFTRDQTFCISDAEDYDIQSKEQDIQSNGCGSQSLNTAQNKTVAQELSVKTPPPEANAADLDQVLTAGTDDVAVKFHSQLQSVFSRLAETTSRLSKAEGERDLLKAELTSRQNQVTSLQQRMSAENEKRLLTELKMMEMLGGEFIERRRQIKERGDQLDLRNVKREGTFVVQKSEGGADHAELCKSRDLDTVYEANDPVELPMSIRDENNDTSEVNPTFSWLSTKRYTPTYSWLPPTQPSPSCDRAEPQNEESSSNVLKAWTGEEDLKRRSTFENCSAARSPPKSKTSDIDQQIENCNRHSVNSSANRDRSMNTLGQFAPRAIMQKFKNLIQGYQEQESGAIEEWNHEKFLVDFGNESVLASPMDHEFYSAPTSPNVNANHLIGDNVTTECISSLPESLSADSFSKESLSSDCVSSEYVQSEPDSFFQFKPSYHKSDYLKTTQLGCGHAALSRRTLAQDRRFPPSIECRANMGQACFILEEDINCRA